MERLTVRNSMGVAVLKTPYRCERCGEEIYRLADQGNGEPIEKLAQYEDLRGQGKLPELSCAVGDTVYVISRMDIIPMEVIGVSMFLLNSKMVIQFNGFCDTEMWNMHFTDDDIGQNVFLTQKEAKEALERMVE